MQQIPTILAENISFSWLDTPTLHRVSLTLNPGEMLGLLGPNGGGKTTLISLIAGLVNPAEGHIQVNGVDVRQQALTARKSLGFVFQSVSLDPFMSVLQNLEFAAGLQGMSERQISPRIAELCDSLPIKAYLHKPVGALSGGQKRLVDIARALVHNPKVLILDEPTTALDPSAKGLLWSTLKSLQERNHLSILVATHLMDEAQDCDRVTFLRAGRIEWTGTPVQALDQLPDQSVTQTRRATLADWFIWKMSQTHHHD
ncbi:ABC transporter ATP-binding protein [Limnobacter litoralis]|uniref:ABC transporter domain-containing protein n=1 Tax=Limnobacter litoralis TaxID=481366 RepID=A0ABQ5YSV4_9BURK|nr:ABC transporter ATP-binding protein [Limnobacter litoralis]GLR27578.1 hypothetical protein GCM10007875_26690 [Limnobacter litoralis]